MRAQRMLGFSLLLMCCVAASGKDKKKGAVLPADILQARTVLVLIDPQAGMSIDAPNANQSARDAVERALMDWGRFELVMDVSTADLIITVRKGNGKMVEPTIGGLPNNQRTGIYEPTDGGGRVGASHGSPPMTGDPNTPPGMGPRPQIEAGPKEDMFEVYRGDREAPLDSSPVWRYSAKDALNAPGVPAVSEFRKAIVAAENQQGNKP